MHGELTSTSTAGACRDLSSAGATGVLEVVHARGAGRIVFERGRVVSASSPTPGPRLGDRLVNAGLVQEDALASVLRRQGERAPQDRPRLGRLLVDEGLVTPDAVRLVVQEQVIDAVFELTSWDRGRFTFSPTMPEDTPEVPLSVVVDQLLVEVARRRDEWEALSRVIPDLNAVPRFREGASGSNASLEPDEFAVLASVDGDRSVRELAEDLGYGEFEAARVIYALILLGQVEMARPVDEIGAALDDAMRFDPHVVTPEFDLDLDMVDGQVTGEAAPADADLGPATDDSHDRWAVENEGTIIPAEPDPVGTEDEDTPEEDEEPDGFAAFAELRAFMDDEDLADTPPPGRPPAPADGEPPAPQPPADAPEPPAPAPTPRPRPAGSGGGDVSEFLRELSRLALDDEPVEKAAPSPPPRDDAPAPKPPPAPRSPSSRDASGRDEPKRKRRLFGRGG
jgi:hypothetical protein